jgi:hypothetical protein
LKQCLIIVFVRSISDAVIFKHLIYIETRLPRYARNDHRRDFSRPSLISVSSLTLYALPTH